jgi:hypothetical protein
MCQHSHYTGVMNPGIVTNQRKFGTRCANTRTTWDKWGIWRELPPHRRGITSLLVQIQAGKIKISGELEQFQDQQLQILNTDATNFFKNLNTKTSLKLKMNLIQPY